MKLCYRGVSYDANPTPVAVKGKQNQVQFRGCSYTMSHAVVNAKDNHDSDIVYRGVSLSDGEEARFLGRTYTRQTVVLMPDTAFA